MKNLERGNGHASGKSVGRGEAKATQPDVHHGGTVTTAEVPSRVQGFSGEKREKKEKTGVDYYKNLYYANKLQMEFIGLRQSKSKRSLKDFCKAYIIYSLIIKNS